ncbi:MAG: glycosyltransferase [Nocardioidaceae bacterium]|nr:glycosyltransferase [Nocardioidaceae bacterium]
MTADPRRDEDTHLVSVVVPVYRGEQTLAVLLGEILTLTKPFVTPNGHDARIAEVLLVHDHGPDQSARVIRDLAARYDVVRPVWLSRNFGQHAATLAGMASSGGDWIVTLDEDGQHDPAEIGAMLDIALSHQATVVYAEPVNNPPHGVVRNAASHGAKWLIDKLVGGEASSVYHSYRLVLGEVGRSVAAYAGAGVYLDIALGWVAGEVATCPVRLRDEADRPSGYNLRTLASHFWRMVLTSGTRLLRVVSVLGVAFALFGLIVALVLVINRFTENDIMPGWTSVIVVVLLSTGAMLFSLGIVAEYLGVAVNMAMGKPLYLIVGDPQDGPLGRHTSAESTRRAESSGV